MMHSAQSEVGPDASVAARRSFVERMLHAIGAEAAFTEAILGDLAEERALRTVRDGAAAAFVWYLRDALRSTPHLIVNAMRFGGPRVRARIATFFGIVALVFTSVIVAIVMLRNGPPATIASGYGTPDEGIVINNLGPIQLPMKVADARGRTLATTDVHFKQIDGPAVAITSNGIVTCKQAADATIRASIGSLVTNLSLHCRPVETVRAASWTDFIEGDPPRDAPFAALSPTGAFVRDLRGTIRIGNPGVAALVGTSIRPLHAGVTSIEIEVGEQKAHSQITVYERVRSFASLRRDQHFVALSIRLAQGDTMTYAMPRGNFWLKYIPLHANDAPPTITVDGRMVCTAGDGIHAKTVTDGEQAAYCFVDGDDARVTVAHGRMGKPVVEGSLALDRTNIPGVEHM